MKYYTFYPEDEEAKLSLREAKLSSERLDAEDKKDVISKMQQIGLHGKFDLIAHFDKKSAPHGRGSRSLGIINILQDKATANVRFQYYDTDSCEDKQIIIPLRMLEVVIETLDDYAGILVRAVDEFNYSGKKQINYTIRARKCLEASTYITEAIGFDKTYPKCKEDKLSSVGDDAMQLLAKRQEQKSDSH